MPRVLIVAPAASVKGGISTVIKGIETSSCLADFEFVRVSSHVDGRKPAKLWAALSGLSRAAVLMLSRRVDLVYLHSGDDPSPSRKYLFYRLARLAGLKCVIHWHAAAFMDQYPGLPGFWQRRIRSMLAGAQQVICLSESWRDNLLKLAPTARITVLPNAVTLPLIASEKVSNSPVRITFLGLIGPRKGIWDLLESLSRLKQTGLSFRLAVGGNGEIEKFTREVERLGLNDLVEYLGWISAEQRDRLLRLTDIFVLPSYGEGLPMSVLEAMSYAAAVVATPVGGLPELIAEGRNGLLVAPGDVAGLSARLAELIVDPDLRAELGRAARLTVGAHHDLNSYCVRLRQVLEQVVQAEIQGGLNNAIIKC